MKELLLLSCFLILSSCNTIPVPKGESCVILEQGCFCKNTLDDSEYMAECLSFVAVSPDRYKELQDHYDSVAQRLLICKRTPKKCQ